MKVLGLDFETTGLNPKKDRVIECGAVLWDTDAKKPLLISSQYILPDNTEINSLPPEIEKITGISHHDVNAFGMSFKEFYHKQLEALLAMSDYCVAHNAAFDREFLLNEGGRIDGFSGCELEWIDTRTDLPQSAYSKGKSSSLGYLAADNGFLNPFAHRAVFDVLTMLKLMSMFSFDEIIKRSESPNVSVAAIVSFDDRDKPKSCGFHWSPERKIWIREIKKCDIDICSPAWNFKWRETE